MGTIPSTPLPQKSAPVQEPPLIQDTLDAGWNHYKQGSIFYAVKCFELTAQRSGPDALAAKWLLESIGPWKKLDRRIPLSENDYVKLMTNCTTLLPTLKVRSPIDLFPKFKIYTVVGDLYFSKKLYAKAIEIWRQALKYNRLAGVRLGYIYYKGLGVKQDWNTALKYLSASQPCPIAEYMMGKIYKLEYDYALAYRWFFTSASRNHDKAQWALTQMYLKGFGVEHNQKTALDYCNSAAKNHHTKAQRMLSEHLSSPEMQDYNRICENGYLYIGESDKLD